MTFEHVNHKPVLNTPGEWFRVMFCGACMGAADLVPGFSGGTVAFIMGIYPDLLRSIVSFNARAFGSLLTFRISEFFRQVGWEFLAALLIGIMASMSLWVHVIHYMLADPTLRMYLMAAFLGLVISSIGICAKQVRNWNLRQCGWLVFGVAVAFLSVYGALQERSDHDTYDIAIPSGRIPKFPDNSMLINYDRTSQRILGVSEPVAATMLSQGIVEGNAPAFSHVLQKEGLLQDFVTRNGKIYIDFYIMFCGAIAICALLLPGVSGSYLLVILGVYATIIGALADLVYSWTQMSFDNNAFFILFSLAVGIVIGIAVFARVVQWLMHHFHDQTVATMTGFVLGAMPAVWPFWSYAYVLLPLRLQDGPQLKIIRPLVPDVTAGYFWGCILTAVTAFTLAYLLEYASRAKSGTSTSRGLTER